MVDLEVLLVNDSRDFEFEFDEPFETRSRSEVLIGNAEQPPTKTSC
jgi:hypothetical protein